MDPIIHWIKETICHDWIKDKQPSGLWGSVFAGVFHIINSNYLPDRLACWQWKFWIDNTTKEEGKNSEEVMKMYE